MFHLFGCRTHRLARENTDSPARAAMFAYDSINDGFFTICASLPSLRLANAAAGFTQKAALDDPILKRVKRDDREPPAVSQLRDRSGNKTLERR